MRVFDIADPYRPEEVGYFVPPQPTRWAEPMRGRAKMRHTADVFVAQDGLIYVTDYDAGTVHPAMEGELHSAFAESRMFETVADRLGAGL